MKILIGADLVPTQTNQDRFENGRVDELIDDGLRALLASADYRIFNLEVPLADALSPIAKCGPNLIASTKSVAGIKRLGADFLTLANNHILDQGVRGLRSTLDALDGASIAYSGVGENLADAAKPFAFALGDKKIGVYCCAEREFSVAEENAPGANPFDPLESLDRIAALKATCDYAICLYHGGKEHYRYPSPNLRKTCRKIVEKGADLVVCQHSHCVGCQEEYRGGTIVYGQGNFLFDRSKSEFWQTALLVEVAFDGDKPKVSFVPLLKDGAGVRLERDGEAEILRRFEERSAEIAQDGFVEARYRRFCDEFDGDLALTLVGAPVEKLWFRVLNKLTGRRFARRFVKRKLNAKRRLKLRNYVECEAWRELVLATLTDRNDGDE